VIPFRPRQRARKLAVQRQVRMMFDRLGRDPNETLSAFFVPFRSESLSDVSAKRESLADD